MTRCLHLSHQPNGICNGCGEQHEPLAPPAERNGKQIFINGEHAADATSEGFAQMITDAIANASIA